MKYSPGEYTRFFNSVLLLAAVSYFLFAGAVPLFDWDEINFAECAREMLLTGNWLQVQMDFQPFWEKPPLFFWLQAIAMAIFGVNEPAARLPNAIIGICTLLALFNIGSRIRGAGLGFIFSALYAGSILPHVYFKSGIIDPAFNFFIFLAVAQIIRYEQLNAQRANHTEFRKTLPLAAGFWIGIATLTKGPVALLLTLLTYGLYLLLFQKITLPFVVISRFTLAYVGVVGSWLGLETLVYGSDFIVKFITYQIELFTQPVAGHQQPFWYHFAVFSLGCFPMAGFALRGITGGSALSATNYSEQAVQRLAVIWWWVVLIVFSISQTKILHYSSLAYFPAVILAGFHVLDLIENNQSPSREVWLFYIIGAIAISGIGFAVPYIGNHPELLRGIPMGEFEKACLQTPVQWSGWEYWIGIGFGLAVLGGFFLLLAKWYISYLIVQVLATAIYLNFLNYAVVPKIAMYTQGPAVEFFKQHAGTTAYFFTYKYKSYVPYFYGNKYPWQVSPTNDVKTSVIRPDQLAYISCKIPDAKWLEEAYPSALLLYKKGGFAFYVYTVPAKNEK